MSINNRKKKVASRFPGFTAKDKISTAVIISDDKTRKVSFSFVRS